MRVARRGRREGDETHCVCGFPPTLRKCSTMFASSVANRIVQRGPAVVGIIFFSGSPFLVGEAAPASACGAASVGVRSGTLGYTAYTAQQYPVQSYRRV